MPSSFSGGGYYGAAMGGATAVPPFWTGKESVKGKGQKGHSRGQHAYGWQYQQDQGYQPRGEKGWKGEKGKGKANEMQAGHTRSKAYYTQQSHNHGYGYPPQHHMQQQQHHHHHHHHHQQQQPQPQPQQQPQQQQQQPQQQQQQQPQKQPKAQPTPQPETPEKTEETPTPSPAVRKKKARGRVTTIASEDCGVILCKVPPKFNKKSLSSCSQKVKEYNHANHPYLQCLYETLLTHPQRAEQNYSSCLIQVMCDTTYKAITPPAVFPCKELMDLQHPDLVTMVKKSQRDTAWNQCWKDYCASHAPSRRRDPATHANIFIRSAVTYCLRETMTLRAGGRPGLELVKKISKGRTMPGLKMLYESEVTAAELWYAQVTNTEVTDIVEVQPVVIPEKPSPVPSPKKEKEKEKVEHPKTPPAKPKQQTKPVPQPLQKPQSSSSVNTLPPAPTPNANGTKPPRPLNAPSSTMPTHPTALIHSKPPTDRDEREGPPPDPHSRTPSLDIDWNMPPPTVAGMMHPSFRRPQINHARTCSTDSMPPLLSGSPLPPPPHMPLGAHSRTTSMDSGFAMPPYAHSPKHTVNPAAVRRAMHAHQRTLSSDSITNALHGRTTSMEIPSLASELSTASPSPCPPSPFDPHGYANYPEQTPISPLGGYDQAGYQPPLEPYYVDANTWGITIDVRHASRPADAILRDFHKHQASFDGVAMQMSDNGCSLFLSAPLSGYELLREAGQFALSEPHPPAAYPAYPPAPHMPAAHLPTASPPPAVGVEVDTLPDVQKARDYQDTTEGVGWIPEMEPYCGQRAIIVRYDEDDQRSMKCRLQFYNRQEYTWALAACHPVPVPQVPHEQGGGGGGGGYAQGGGVTQGQAVKLVHADSDEDEGDDGDSFNGERTLPSQHQPLPSISDDDEDHAEVAVQEEVSPEVQAAMPLVVAVIVAVCTAARDDSLPDLPRLLAPRPESCQKCGARNTLVTMKQRKGARLRSYRFECSECEAQHLQAKEDGTTRLVTSTEHLATSNSVRKKEKSLKDQAKRAETKQQGDISECSSEMDGVPSPATSHAK